MAYQYGGVVFSDNTQWPPGFLTSFFYPQMEQLLMSVMMIWDVFPDAEINSWFRDPDYNAIQRPPGKPLSSHLLGLGLDVIRPGGTQADYDQMGALVDGYVGDGTGGQYGPGYGPGRTFLPWTDTYEGKHLHVQVYYGNTPESNQAFRSVYDVQPWYLDWIAQYVTDPRQLNEIDYT